MAYQALAKEVRQLLLERDECEVRISGIPASVTTSTSRSVERILEVIGIENPTRFILDYRGWLPGASADLPEGVEEASNTASSLVTVVKLTSNVVRDLVLEKAVALRSLTAHMIFETGGDTRVYINPIWPKPIYELLKCARERSKSLGYALPLVKNMIVHVRETPKSKLIPIFRKSDLGTLPRRSAPSREYNNIR